MKKILFVAVIIGSILVIGSCDSDDSDSSNDIDIITPNDDTTETSMLNVPLLRKA